jgi:hypothetical protein
MRHAYPIAVAFALAALTCLIVLATPVAAGDAEYGFDAYLVGYY